MNGKERNRTMKANLKKLAFVMLAAAAMSAPAADVLSFWPAEDPADTYADGTEIVGKAIYALVWVAKGVPFQGFLVDGTLVNKNEDENHLFVTIAAAPGQGVEFNLSTYGGYSTYIKKDGSWNVYLLDGRVLAPGADGKTGFVEPAGGVAKPGSAAFTGVNAWGLVGEADEVGKYQDAYFEPESTSAGEIAALPEGSSPVKISGIEIVNVDGEERVRLTVANTVKCVWYDATRGPLQKPMTEQNVSVQPKTGVGEGAITLDVPKDVKDDSKFYQVIRRTVK